MTCIYYFKSCECGYKGDLPYCENKKENCRSGKFVELVNRTEEEIRKTISKKTVFLCDVRSINER